ncbi:MAG: preprotein translocase subunit SecE [Clostridia bacterium]|jgi:preprotein translocase subunit SecE|nr:preprotein translocase subunit SecE [Clostridia bacterium]
MAKKENSAAAEKVAAAEKNQTKKAKSGENKLVKAGKAIKKWFKDLKGEIKKIVWPDAKTVVKSTLVVLAAVAICAAAIFAVDYVLSKAISLLELAAGKIGDATKVEEVAEEGLMTLRNFFLG